MAIKESDIKAMMKTVMSTTMKTVSSGQKAIISPTEVRNITKEIVADAESGSITRFEKALDKTKTILDKLDVDLKDFNTSLAKRIKDLDEQNLKSSKEVEQLRSQNIVAEVKANKEGKQFAYETNILTKKEIETRKSILEKNKNLVEREENKIIAKREKLLSQETLGDEDKAKIISDEQRITALKEKLQKEEDVLTPLSKKDDMAGPSSSFYQALKEPFIAVGDAFMSLKDIGTDVVRVFKFFSEGGLTKGLKSFKKGVMALGKFFMSTKVLIGLAIVGVIAAVVFFKDKIKAAANFIMGIPDMIGNFIKKAFTRISDFFKDMINTVIKLINKYVPFANVPLLETSVMKEEKEEKEKQERIKQGAKEFSGDVDVNTESGFRDKGAYLEPKFEQTQGFSDDAGMGMEQSNIVYDKGSKSAILMNRQVVGDQLKGAGATGTGDASTAKTLYQESKQASMYDTGEVPPVIVNNSNQSSVNSSGSSTVGFINNKNVDDTFTNLNYVMP